MKINTLALTALSAALFLLTACERNPQPKPQLPYWQDIDVTSVNAETRRTETILFPTREQALEKGFRESANYVDLNGSWDFRYFDDHHDMEAFVADSLEAAAWDAIQVPGNWEVQGYGIALYTNIPYEFCPRNPVPGKLPEVVPGGVYHRRFTLPDQWDGRRIYLNLAGAKSGVYVYVNGKEIGYSEDSKSLARFDISAAVLPGENELVLKIYRWSTGSFLECQDFWRISGIERDVYLSSEGAEARLADFRVVSTLDESFESGIFRLEVTGEIPDFGYELLDSDGTAVLEGAGAVEGEACFEGTVPEARHWTAETPELYTLVLRIGDEYTRFHVGFRRIEIAPWPIDDTRTVHCLLINGQPVKFKGVNLHEHNEYTGHYTDKALILKDLTLMRAANINAIRTCHYPQPREFYELCDSLGFYVYNEANIESHGMGYRFDRTLANKTDWYLKHEDRDLNIYYRTGNYPCVTIISLGNEAGNGVNFFHTYRLLKELEIDGQNRPVCYERAEHGWNTDMIVPQYPGADWFKEMGEKYDYRPVCPSEYAHAMGNSTGSLDLQWDAIYAWPHLQGGFIWDWVDQGLAEVDSLGRKYWTYGGDYGVDSPSDANFLCNGIVNPDRRPHPGYYEVRHVYQDAVVEGRFPEKGAFRIHNRFYFRDLNAYKLSWSLFADGVEQTSGVVPFNDLVTIPPQTYFDFTIPMPKLDPKKEYFILFSLSALQPGLLIQKGQVVAFSQILVQEPEERAYKAAQPALTSVYENEENFVLTGGGAEVEFDVSEGRITYWKVGGVDMIDPEFGIRPNYWRGPTDNDYGNGEPKRNHEWKLATQKPEVDSVQVSDRGVLTATYKLPYGAALRLEVSLGEGGVLRLASDFIGGPRPDRPVDWRKQNKDQSNDIPRIGVRMRVPAGTWDRFGYYGRGPQENYCDRNGGTPVGYYESTPAAEFYPYVRPQECGHHTDVRFLKGGNFEVQSLSQPFEFNVLNAWVEDLDSEEATDHDYQWNNFSPNDKKDPEKAANVLRRQTHVNDVPQRETVELCIDGFMSGIGGYDSWGSWPDHERTIWDNRNYSWSVELVPSKKR